VLDSQRTSRENQPKGLSTDPLAALLRQLAQRADSPRVRRWAAQLLAGEGASGKGSGRVVLHDRRAR
jgi:hypothetical protein